MNKSLRGMEAAMFSTPSNYQEAQNKYYGDLQSKIDETWWMSSNNFEIQVELTPGTREFTPVVCRVNHAIQPKTGLNLGDDFKELTFFDLNYPVKMGMRFIFSDSWWIVTNTDNYNYPTKSAIVRRCNNVLKYIHNGSLIEEPCIIEYAIKYANVYYNDVLNIPQGTIEVICQSNSNTIPITYNDRFIFGSEVYKVKTVRDYLRQNTWDKSSNPLIQLSMYVDSKGPDDDFENGIASIGGNNPNENTPQNPNSPYEVVVQPVQDDLLIGETVNFSCYLQKNEANEPNTFTFTASGVPEECYELIQIDGNNFTLTNRKEYFQDVLAITCMDNTGMYSKTIKLALKGMY